MSKKIDKLQLLREKQLEKARIKALGEVLVNECREKNTCIDTLKDIISQGGEVTHSNAKALLVAAKELKFDVVKFLIENGILKVPVAYSYVAKMIDFKGYKDDEHEELYFGLLKTLIDLDPSQKHKLLEPYINAMCVQGKLPRLLNLLARFNISHYEVANIVGARIICEVVVREHFDILAFIEMHNKWIDQEAFDSAVRSNEWLTLEYILKHSDLRVPTDKAVGEALYAGHFEVLHILEKIGYDFYKSEEGKDGAHPLYLERAARSAMYNNTNGIKFLFEHGYGPSDSYNGKTLVENAIDDNNFKLLAWLKENPTTTRKKVVVE
ncbi:MAG: hypothetical protein FWE22_04135 [Firmicutes bacterium]|nr:hypothetical protein [Bacillota bacterium]